MQELAMSLSNFDGLWKILGGCAALLVLCAGLFAVCGKKDRMGSLLVAVAFAEAAAVFIFLTNGIDELPDADSSSKLMPYIWSLPLFFVSLLQIVRIWRKNSVKPAEPGRRYDKVFFTFVVVALTICGFDMMGFFLSTGLMLLILMLLFGERRVSLIAGTILCWEVFTYVVFNKVLLLGLPMGTLLSSVLQ